MKTLIEDLKKVINSEIEDKDKYMELLINGFVREKLTEQLFLHDVVVNEADAPADKTLLDEPLKLWETQAMELANIAVELPCDCGKILKENYHPWMTLECKCNQI